MMHRFAPFVRPLHPQRSGRSVRPSLVGFLLAVLFGVGAAPVLGAEGPALDPVCEPSPAVADVLRASAEVGVRCGSSAECAERRLALIEDALEGSPESLHLHRALQDLWQPHASLSRADPEGREQVVERYRARLELQPDDPAALYLLGRILEDGERPRELYDRAVKTDPRFPWSHLGVLHGLWTLTPGTGPAPEAVRRHAGAFLERCPSRFDMISGYQKFLPDKAFWRDHLAASRGAIREMDLERALPRYPAVWEGLYTATPLARHADEVDPVVREDLARIEAFGLEERESWLQALDTAYELLGNEEGRERIADLRLRRAPCTSRSARIRLERWQEEHPEPEQSAPEEERRAHQRALWEQTGMWLEQCPEETVLWARRLFAALELDALPAEEVGELGDKILDLADSGALRFGTGSSPLLQVARLYAAHEVRLDRVRELAEQGGEEALEGTREYLAQDSLPENLRSLMSSQIPFLRWRTLSLSTRAAIARERPEEARELLVDVRALADELRPGEGAEAKDEEIFRTIDGGYWGFRADLAELEERPMDAAVYRARSAAYLPEDASDELEEARTAWSEAGGSAEAWQALLEGLREGGLGASDAEGLRWSEEEDPLPEFELADLSGGTWSRADLEGKTIFANVWATWCGPCREELPLVEKLHERLKGRDDVAVVTLNIDSNPGLAARFVEKEDYTFPVLQASGLVTRMGRASGIPRSWIIDPSAVLRREQIGFGRSEDWMGGVLDLLEQYGADPADSSPSDEAGGP